MEKTQPDSGTSESARRAPASLRFGLMCRGTNFPVWQAQCLEMLLKLGYAEPALLIVDGRTELLSSSPLWKKLGKLLRLKVNLFSIYKSYYVSRRCRATRPVDMSAALAEVPQQICQVIRKGKFSEYFHDQDLAVVQAHDLDFILRFGFNIIRGDILSVPRYGVWSFHHGDEQKYRGAPPCFWEIYQGQPETGCMLQRLTERLDGGVVLKKGRFPTIHHSYPRNRDAAHFAGVSWPAQVCKDLLAGRAGYLQDPPTATTAPIYLEPTNRQMIVFGLKQAWNITRNIFRSLGAVSQKAPVERPVK